MKLSITNEFSAGAVGWYRGHGVIGHLPIEWKNPDNQNWVEMMDTSIQLLIRPWNQRFASLMYISEINGVPVWSDFDDDYLAIPEHNRAYPILKKHEPNFEQITKEIIKTSKVVTVTTEYLKNKFSEFNPNTIIVPNAFNDYRFKLPEVPSENQKILWRGTDSHKMDLVHFNEPIKKVNHHSKDWEWYFNGNNLWWFTLGMKNTYEAEEVDIHIYFNALREIQPSIVMVPLTDETFNHAKSNIAWIEATYAGATCLAPNFPEWRRDGVCNYNDEKDFRDKLEKLMNDVSYRRKFWYDSKKYIEENLLLSNVNKMRMNIINNFGRNQWKPL